MSHSPVRNRFRRVRLFQVTREFTPGIPKAAKEKGRLGSEAAHKIGLYGQKPSPPFPWAGAKIKKPEIDGMRVTRKVACLAAPTVNSGMMVIFLHCEIQIKGKGKCCQTMPAYFRFNLWRPFHTVIRSLPDTRPVGSWDPEIATEDRGHRGQREKNGIGVGIGIGIGIDGKHDSPC